MCSFLRDESHKIICPQNWLTLPSSSQALYRLRRLFYALHQKSSLTRFVAPPLRTANASLVCSSVFVSANRSIAYNSHKKEAIHSDGFFFWVFVCWISSIRFNLPRISVRCAEIERKSEAAQSQLRWRSILVHFCGCPNLF